MSESTHAPLAAKLLAAHLSDLAATVGGTTALVGQILPDAVLPLTDAARVLSAIADRLYGIEGADA